MCVCVYEVPTIERLSLPSSTQLHNVPPYLEQNPPAKKPKRKCQSKTIPMD